MALTKVQKTGITDNAIDADKIEDGTIVAADIAPGTITDAKLASTLDLSSKTVTLPNTSVTNAMLAGSIANDKLANSSITINGSSVSLGGSVSAGKVSWQSVKTADFNAVAGEGYFVDTNSVGAVTATLPGSPSAGDTIAFKDYAGTFGTNSLTIARNGNNIQGVANNSEISTNRASVVLVYIDATKGWLYTNESNVANLQTYIVATGGTVTTSGDFKIHTFTGDGCFVVSQAGSGDIGNTVDYLVIGGGASGGNGIAGGGGAGGFRESHSTPVSGCYSASPLATPTGITISATTYPITVGAGGATNAPGNVRGLPGNNSIFSSITSTGGGAGAGYNSSSETGGSGGGGAGLAATSGAAGNTPPVSPPQGNNGGNGSPGGDRGGGGGGGATAAGANSPSGGVAGGAGATTSISASPTAYAGGGGSGSDGSGGPGGIGGGGSGGGLCTPGNAGTTNTGGGGGGGGPSANGGTGGKGIVIIRYKFQN